MVDRRVPFTEPSVALTLCLLSSGLLLAGAHWFERVGGLPPCLLCLEQREAHWAAVGFGAAMFGLARMANTPRRVIAAALGALCLVYVFSSGLAAYHAGVEWGFWAGPALCSGSPDVQLASAGDLLASLAERSVGPACSEASWRLFGVSMAGYNALISLALAGLAAGSCLSAAQNLRDNRVNAAALAE